MTTTTTPLRTALVAALTDLGYKPTANTSGDVVLCTVVTTGKIPWIAEFTLHPASNVIVAAVIVSIDFQPKVKPPEMQELLAHVNTAIVFGAFLIRPGQSCVVYRTARDFPDGISATQIARFLGQLNFPLSVWVELCKAFPKGTDVRSRLDAVLIRLGAHDGTGITRRTRKALLRVIRAEDSAESAPAISVGLRLM